MCKTYHQRVFCPGDTHRTEIVRTVRAVDADISVDKNTDFSISLPRQSYQSRQPMVSEDSNDSIITDDNPSCDCGIVTMIFLPPIIDYSLEATCEGCITEEKEMVERVMALKRAIAEIGREGRGRRGRRGGRWCW